MTHTVLQSAPAPLAEAPATRVLHPGDVACASQGDRLETLLGSCVAVALTDPRHTVGALCHIVHPAGPFDGDTRFGAAALERARQLLQSRGIVLRLCHAWVMGGGNMFPGHYRQAHVGDANVRWVLQALAHHDVFVAGQHLGGPHYRRVRWTVGDDAPLVTAVALSD